MCDQTKTFARCNVQFPIGTILMYWGDPQALQDSGWAVCDGKPPEPGWNEQAPAPAIPITPNLVTSIPVGTDRSTPVQSPRVQNELVVTGTTEPHQHVLESHHELWEGLKAQGWDNYYDEGRFVERPFQLTRAECSSLTAKGKVDVDHLPGQKVYFIIKYKHVY